MREPHVSHIPVIKIIVHKNSIQYVPEPAGSIISLLDLTTLFVK